MVCEPAQSGLLKIFTGREKMLAAFLVKEYVNTEEPT